MSAEETPGGLPEGVTRKEFDEIVASVRDLATALADVRTAKGDDDEAEAKHEAGKAKADLDAVSSELGIDPKRLRKLAEEAKTQDERDKIRRIVLEVLDEEIKDDEPDPAADDDPPADEKPDGEAEAAADEPPVEDSAPAQEHWSDKPLSAMFKR